MGSPLICRRLILPDIDYAGKVAVVTGWGRVNETGNISPILAQVEVPIYTNEACQKTKYGKQAITENMMCAGYDHGELDACQGDSGGPLHLEGKDRKIDLIGKLYGLAIFLSLNVNATSSVMCAAVML
jgi:hypothetical protein